MDFIRIGNSGLYTTQLVYGTALTIGTEITSQNKVNVLINTAWNSGIRAFDTSNNYGNGIAEKLLGKSLLFYDRSSYILSSKVSWPVGETPYFQGLSRKHVLSAVENTLNNLKVNFIDIYYAHRFDPNVSIKEIVNVFNYLINKGKILYWATSEWPVYALNECLAYCQKFNLEPPIGDQFIFSYIVNKVVTNGVYNFCNENKYGMLGYSPLAQGILTGKYQTGIPKDSRIGKSKIINYEKTKNFINGNEQKIEKFIIICKKYNLSPTHAAIRWVIKKGVIPIIGASKPEQIIDNVKALSIIIPDDFWIELDSI